MRYGSTDFNDKTVLVTGGAGFIGSNIAFYLQSNFPKSRIVVLDKFRDGSRFENGNPTSYGHFGNLIGFNGEVVCGDIRDDALLQRLFEEYDFDFIFHQAAISDTRVYDQEIVMQTNINSFHTLLKLCRQYRSDMIYASSASTYGSLPAPQTVGKEAPENPYGFSKYAMDRIAYRYMSDFPQMRIIGLRYFNVYGPREHYKGKTASTVLQFGLQILSGKAPKLFEGSKSIYRDFIYIDDVIQANIKACEGKNGVYNVGTGKARTFLDIALILQDLLNVDYGIEYIPNPYRDYQRFTQADIESTEESLGYKPQWSLERGIEAYLPEIKRIYQTGEFLSA